jgi:hypothetical protein
MSFFQINNHSLEVFKYQLLQLTSKRGKALKLVGVWYQLVTCALTSKSLQVTHVIYYVYIALFFQ